MLLLYKQESIYFHSLQQIYFFPSEYEKAMMNLRFLFKKTNSLLLNVGYFSSHYQRDIMPGKQERIIVVSCVCRTCDTRRVLMRFTAMRYIVSKPNYNTCIVHHRVKFRLAKRITTHV